MAVPPMNESPLLTCGICGLPVMLGADTNGYIHLFHGWDPAHRRKKCPKGLV